MDKVILNVGGMSCGMCAMSIQSALLELGAKGEVDLAEKTVTITYDGNAISLDQIKKAIEDIGYEV
ncbi:heavy-metal-associated domain-containing protein [Paenibacillus lautus]|uniref:heavy-metal-associated domain-containing protein n=1 Tax=Paenibacillus lautus TaxID=1401 RepID=UPI003D2BBB54